MREGSVEGISSTGSSLTNSSLFIVRRDRGSEFAAAARTAAPQARQIADRFHIVHNLSEALVGQSAINLRKPESLRPTRLAV